MPKGHFKHKGRPGKLGGSLPKGATNLASLFAVLKGGARSGNFGHSGRQGERGGSAPSNFTSNISVDPVTTNEEDALKQIKDYLSHIPSRIQSESSIRSLEVFENPEDATDRINELEPGGIEEDEIARGAYNRETGKAVVSLYYADDRYLEASGIDSQKLAYSGRNFYHEFAHSLENKITSGKWEKAWGEWEYSQDEGFSNAFASYMVSKRLSNLGYPDEMKSFQDNYPVTHEVFKEWEL